MRRVSSGRQVETRNGQARLQGRPSRSEMLGELDGISLCLIAVTCVLASSFQNFRVSLSRNDGFTIIEYIKLATCFPYIFLLVAPWMSWITCRPNVPIFRDTAILVVISYLILLDINLSFLWLAIFPVMAIVFIVALYFKFSPGTPGSSKVTAEKSNRKTWEFKIIVIMTFGALIVMDQLPDHAAEGFPISQFLLFLSSMVAALTRMLMKLPAGASLPGVARSSAMLHKSLLLLLLLTEHTVAAEWLGEDVVLLCLLEVIPVLLWFSLHLDRKPGSANKTKTYRKSLVFLCAVVAPLIVYLAISKDYFGLSSSFMCACVVSGMLTYYLACSLAMIVIKEN